MLNELSVLPEDLDLVLDDYHLAESPAIQPGMAFLLDRLPPQVRLVIGTRADPALPLARLRAQGELTEVRAADLRFTADETAAFLVDATGLDLAPADVAALGARTEGWIASLQLAAHSLRGRDDPARFIAGFTGDDRYVVDYLVEEVLAHEPAETRAFLLATSILERLSGPLCDAVTGTTGSAQVLESLERRNLFVVPLDDQRRWYRYHHLFADVLRAHLLAERPDEARLLHQRASRWYADAGETEAAVRHALAGGDHDSAADLVELAIPELRRTRREHVIRRWVDELPDDVVARRPVLAAGLIGALMASNDFADVPPRLRGAGAAAGRPARRTWWSSTRPSSTGCPAPWRPGGRGWRWSAATPSRPSPTPSGPTAAAVDGDDLTHAAAAALAGLAWWATGDIPAAHRGYGEALRGPDQVGPHRRRARLLARRRRHGARPRPPRRAERTLEQALALAERHRPDGPDAMRGTADMLVGLSRAAWHRNDLAGAAELLRRADDLGEAGRAPAEPVPLAGGDGPAPGLGGRPRRRAGAPRRGRARLRR